MNFSGVKFNIESAKKGLFKVPSKIIEEMDKAREE